MNMHVMPKVHLPVSINFVVVDGVTLPQISCHAPSDSF